MMSAPRTGRTIATTWSAIVLAAGAFGHAMTEPAPPSQLTLTCNGRPVTIAGTSRDDVLVGTDGDDVIAGSTGNDTIHGGGGNDLICGDNGLDTLWGGAGNDVLLGGRGNDTLDGGDGNDTLLGGGGEDVLAGGNGDDQLRGGGDNDRVRGDGGNDTFDTDVQPVDPNFHREDRVLNGPAPEILWHGPPLVAPRGITQKGDALFVTDPADSIPGEHARIVRFPLTGNAVGTPTVFFQRPGFLLSAKWSIPIERTDLGLDGFVVADQGEELSDGTFTGQGAKVFFLPELANGEAGEPQIVWEGRPFVCPTGVAVVADFIYVTDPCAGPERTRQAFPNQPFPASALFILNLGAPGPPTLAWLGAPFTSMTGVCAGGGTRGPSGLISLTVHDTDSGRIDPTQTGGRPGFAPPAEAELWAFDITDPATATLARPTRIQLTERGTITVRFRDIPEDGAIDVVTDGSLLENGETRQRFDAGLIEPDGTFSFQLNSPTRDVRVRFGITVVDSLTAAGVQNLPGAARTIILPKDDTQSTQFADNKHGGRKEPLAAAAASDEDFFRISLDSARGHAAIWVFPEVGGATPVALAKGFPLVRPLGAQLHDDQSAAWIADQSGALLFLPLPDIDTLRSLFP